MPALKPARPGGTLAGVITADVVVVGAGPAGAAAAIELGRAGLGGRPRRQGDVPARQDLRGRADHPRVLRSSRTSASSRVRWPVVAVDEIACGRSPSGHDAFALPADGTYCAVAERMDLDAALVDVARKAGADVHEGRAVSATEVDRRRAPHPDGGDVVQARYVVAADGMYSAVRKHLGVARRGYLGDAHAFRQYFRAWPPTGPCALRVVREGPPARLPLVVPVARRAGQRRLRHPPGRPLLGAGHGRAVAGAAGPAAHPRLPRSGRPTRGAAPRVADPGPRRPDAGRAAGRVLFTGDAVAATDRLTGEGIAQALVVRPARRRAIAADGLDPRRPQPPLRAACVHSSPTTGCRCWLIRALTHRKGARRSHRRRPPPGPDATSPAGCSRTSLGPHRHAESLAHGHVHRPWCLPRPLSPTPARGWSS